MSRILPEDWAQTGLISSRVSGESDKAMPARIFQRPKNAMQSGRAGSGQWLLDFVPAEAKRPDPLMGWSGSGDVQQQVILSFATREEAVAYAERHGIDAQVIPTPPHKLKLQAYADNFR